VKGTATEKPTVLIVDDSPEGIDVLKSVLQPDYQIQAAIHGELALRLARRFAPDIILLDVMMPDMDGYEVCRRLKTEEATAGIPVIFMTTLSEAAQEARGLSLGAVDYITKPYVPMLVRARIATHLALHDQNRLLEQKVRERTAELLESRIEIIRRLARAAEYRDNETGMHVIRMSHYAQLLVSATGGGDQEADLVLLAAPLHDIGKIGIPDKILLKTSALAADEWQIMQRHTTIGAAIIGDQTTEPLRTARIVALSHHEHWDGTGYPQGLKGTDIPRLARVVAVADVFDALLSARPYKKPWTMPDAVDTIREGAGRHFDPELVEAFLRVLPACQKIAADYADA
jgi:putative two-component system response regulator